MHESPRKASDEGDSCAAMLEAEKKKHATT